jgi:uncharacterized phage protein (TIGR01671 family)
MKEGAYMELKFRAWEKSLKEMIPVHSIDFQTKMINARGAWRWLHEVELMQYIGLHDKNGKDGYEGDVIREPDSGSMGVIVYCDGQFTIDWKLNKGFYNNILKYHLPNSEIIGNIYENPELLKEAK